MAIIEWEKEQTVAVVKMNNGANRHNLEFAKCFNNILDTIVNDNDIKALVLTSTDSKNFSQGIDLEWLLPQVADTVNGPGQIKEFMYGMNDVFKKMLTIPIPTIAAINGHAFGNGALLSCSCDFRFMRADRGYFCFPEVDLGIPFLPGMVAFAKKAFPYYKFNEMKLSGRKVGGAELAEHHVIEKASNSPEELLSDAMAFAMTFQKKRGIFGTHKSRLYGYIIDIMETQDPKYIDTLDLFVQE